MGQFKMENNRSIKPQFLLRNSPTWTSSPFLGQNLATGQELFGNVITETGIVLDVTKNVKRSFKIQIFY